MPDVYYFYAADKLLVRHVGLPRDGKISASVIFPYLEARITPTKMI